MTSSPLKQKEAMDFILGGNAIVTFLSVKSQKRFTYKIVLNDSGNSYRVGVLTGGDNNSDYSPLISIKFFDGAPHLMSAPKTWIKRDAPSYIAFEHVFFNLLIGKEMEGLEIWHEGRCCRCGRTLTVPESIQSGIGPECAKIGSNSQNFLRTKTN